MNENSRNSTIQKTVVSKPTGQEPSGKTEGGPPEEANQRGRNKQRAVSEQRSWEELRQERELTIGIDLGDRWSRYCVVDRGGVIVREGNVRTTPAAMVQEFKGLAGVRMVVEVGAHSRWVSQWLEAMALGEVYVANPRKVKLISGSTNKNDRIDARTLARLGRVDVELLSPIRHRSEEAQRDLMVIRGRQALVEVRTQLINCVRGLVKTTGTRVKKCSSESFSEQSVGQIPEPLKPALEELVKQIGQVSEGIARYDEQIETMTSKRYAEEARRLTQVNGVGALTAVTFVLTLEEPGRFDRSREVGPFLGLRPRLDSSGESERQLRITKTGDVYLRQLLVNCGHYILGPFGEDSKLRRWGWELAKRGGKNGKKRAVVAVARKLAVLLHRLWVSGEAYEAMRGCEKLPMAPQMRKRRKAA